MTASAVGCDGRKELVALRLSRWSVSGFLPFDESAGCGLRMVSVSALGYEG